MIVVVLSMLWLVFFYLTIKYNLIIVMHMHTIKSTCLDMCIPQSTCIEPCSRAVAFFHTPYNCLPYMHAKSKSGPVTTIIALICVFPFSVLCFLPHYSNNVLEKVRCEVSGTIQFYTCTIEFRSFVGTLQTVEDNMSCFCLLLYVILCGPFSPKALLFSSFLFPLPSLSSQENGVFQQARSEIEESLGCLGCLRYLERVSMNFV